MENKPSFWEIYKKDAFSNRRAMPLLLLVGFWLVLVFTLSEFDIMQMPKWLIGSVPLLLAELAYIYSCFRKYKAAV
ncbi:hypothetical protein [Pontibacter burrus]|uniref:Uncharacterized protein n=1 Tax=Pontibacter burrus TaxID=2704466 RepID=A0A6B3M1E6_9BACT|nr:hypothetical protein [Pontibacter burrus]NEM99658.1 hypothetical protein [Pontibacter burrus]